MISYYLIFLKDVLTLTLYTPSNAQTLNLDHEINTHVSRQRVLDYTKSSRVKHANGARGMARGRSGGMECGRFAFQVADKSRRKKKRMGKWGRGKEERGR